MQNKLKNILRKTLGVILIIIGLLALVTPFTTGAWLGLVGLELLGLRLIFQEKVFNLFKKYKNKYKQ